MFGLLGAILDQLPSKLGTSLVRLICSGFTLVCECYRFCSVPIFFMTLVWWE